METQYGWSGTFPIFSGTPSGLIRTSLLKKYPDVSPEQVNAWRQSIPPLQSEVREILGATDGAKEYSAILEYELPLESRRPDVLFLLSGAVVVLELKGKTDATQADLDCVFRSASLSDSDEPRSPIPMNFAHLFR